MTQFDDAFWAPLDAKYGEEGAVDEDEEKYAPGDDPFWGPLDAKYGTGPETGKLARRRAASMAIDIPGMGPPMEAPATAPRGAEPAMPVPAPAAPAFPSVAPTVPPVLESGLTPQQAGQQAYRATLEGVEPSVLGFGADVLKGLGQDVRELPGEVFAGGKAVARSLLGGTSQMVASAERMRRGLEQAQQPPSDVLAPEGSMLRVWQGQDLTKPTALEEWARHAAHRWNEWIPETEGTFEERFARDPLATLAEDGLSNIHTLAAVMLAGATGGAPAMAAAGFVLEGTAAGDAAFAEGATPDQAQRQMMRVGIGNMFLESMPASKLLKKLTKGVPAGQVSKRLGGIVEQALAEGVTESFQQMNEIFSAYATFKGDAEFQFSDLTWEDMKETLRAGGAGAFLGGGVAGVAPSRPAPEPIVYQPPPPPVEKPPEKDVAPPPPEKGVAPTPLDLDPLTIEMPPKEGAPPDVPVFKEGRVRGETFEMTSRPRDILATLQPEEEGVLRGDEGVQELTPGIGPTRDALASLEAQNRPLDALDALADAVSPPIRTEDFDLDIVLGEKPLTPEQARRKPYTFKPATTDEEIHARTWYHGTTAVDVESTRDIDLVFASWIALYGPGLYMSDKGALAGTYGDVVLQAHIPEGKFVFLEGVMPEDAVDGFEEAVNLTRETLEANLPKGLPIAPVNLRERLVGQHPTKLDSMADLVFNEAVEAATEMAGKAGYGATAEVFYDHLIDSLQERGYVGFSHEGGQLTEGDPHNVVILWPTGEYRALSFEQKERGGGMAGAVMPADRTGRRPQEARIGKPVDLAVPGARPSEAPTPAPPSPFDVLEPEAVPRTGVEELEAQKPRVEAAPPPVAPEPTLDLEPEPAPVGGIVEQQGKRVTAIDPEGQDHELEYQLVEADDLLVSHTPEGEVNPDYPAGDQPRDKTRKASQLQVQKIGSKIKPELLGASPGVTDGAPITEPEGHVTSGNSRGAGIQLAYRKGNAQSYKRWLSNNAESFGLTQEQVEAMDQPVLVRQRQPSEMAAADFARVANKPTVAKMSETEQARIDAVQLTAEDLALIHPRVDADALMSVANKPFVARFMDRMTEEERGELVDSRGVLSSQGQRRVENAVLQAAYADPGLFARLREQRDDEGLVNLRKALLAAAPTVARQRGQFELGEREADLDISQDIADAVNEYLNIKKRPGKIASKMKDFRAQEEGLTGGLSPVARRLVELFHTNSVAWKKTAASINRYAELVEVEGDPAQGGLFGAVELPGTLETLERAIEERDLVGKSAMFREDEEVEEADDQDYTKMPPPADQPEGQAEGQAGYIGSAGINASVDMTFPYRAEKWFAKWFTNWGTLYARKSGIVRADAIKASKFLRDNANWAKAETRRARQIAGRYSRQFLAHQLETNMNGEELNQDVAHALTSDDANLWLGLPDGLRQSAIAMRDHLDSLGVAIRDEMELTKHLRHIIEKNQGTYLRRTYQAKRNPKEWEHFVRVVQPERWTAFKDWYSRLPENQQKSDDEIVGEMQSMLRKAPATFLLPGGLKQSRAEFLQRQNMPQQYADFLGRDVDPFVRYVEGVELIAHDLAMERTFDQLSELLLQAGAAARTKLGDLTELVEPLTQGQRRRMGRLGKLYVTPEVKLIIDAIGQTQPANFLTRQFGKVKVGKTALSVTTQARNLEAWPIIWLASGHWTAPFRYAAHGAGTIIKGREKGLGKRAVDRSVLEDVGDMAGPDGRPVEDYLSIEEDNIAMMMEGGIHGESIVHSELMETFAKEDLERLKGSPTAPEAKALGWRKEAVQAAMKLYGAADDYGHVVHFAAELSSVAWASRVDLRKEGIAKNYRKIRDQHPDLWEMAVRRTRLTTPTYSRLPPAVRALSKFPVIGSFPSFPVAMVQAVGNSLKIGAEDIARGGRWTGVGAKRIASITVIPNLIPLGLMMLGRSLTGGSDEEEESIRVMGAEWERHSDIVLLDNSFDGKKVTVTFIDLSALNPFAVMTDPIHQVWRSIVNKDRDLDWADLGVDLLRPFIEEDISAATIVNVMRGRDESGRDIWKKDDPWETKVYEGVTEVVPNIAPGILNQAYRIGRATLAPEGTYGREFKLRDELIAALGLRARSFDPANALGWRARDFSDSYISDAGTIARREVGAFEKAVRATPLLRTTEGRVEHIRSEAWEKMSEEVKRTRILLEWGGMTTAQANRAIKKELEDAGVGKTKKTHYRVKRLMAGQAYRKEPKR